MRGRKKERGRKNERERKKKRERARARVRESERERERWRERERERERRRQKERMKQRDREGANEVEREGGAMSVTPSIPLRYRGSVRDSLYTFAPSIPHSLPPSVYLNTCVSECFATRE